MTRLTLLAALYWNGWRQVREFGSRNGLHEAVKTLQRKLGIAID